MGVSEYLTILYPTAGMAPKIDVGHDSPITPHTPETGPKCKLFMALPRTAGGEQKAAHAGAWPLGV
jgi:hypothetical protein